MFGIAGCVYRGDGDDAVTCTSVTRDKGYIECVTVSVESPRHPPILPTF